jgi:hypothetical protein
LDEEKKRRVKENSDSYDFVAAQLVALKQQIDAEKIRKSDDIGAINSSLRGGILFCEENNMFDLDKTFLICINGLKWKKLLEMLL